MKKSNALKLCLCLFLAFLSATSYSQNRRDSVYVKTQIYEAMYSEAYKEPLWVKYTVQCPNGKASRTGMDFYTNDSIATSTNEDYIHNEYDKGHMAPAADFNCTKEMLHLTFSYINCALQNQYLNRGVWKMLEDQERKWAQSEPVHVTIKCVLNKFSIKLPSGATIPSGFFKIIVLEKTGKVIKFYFPNTKPNSNKYMDYQLASYQIK
jgi:endonuclease G, mitochondrial